MPRYQIRLPSSAATLSGAVVDELRRLLDPANFLGEMRRPDETAFLWSLPAAVVSQLVASPVLAEAGARIVRDRRLVSDRPPVLPAGPGIKEHSALNLSYSRSAMSVGIAILDPDGVKDHPAYEGRLHCYDATDQGVVPTTPSVGEDGHGTHLAGVAAGDDCTSPARNATIYSIRARSAWQLEMALRWASSEDLSIRAACIATVAVDGKPLDDQDEIDDLHTAIRDAQSRNVVCCVAAGNRGQHSAKDQLIKSPGTAPEAITVGGYSGNRVDENSSRGAEEKAPPIPDVVLRFGAYKTAAKVGDGFENVNGTSMAAAYMAGVVATWYAAHPGLLATDIHTKILAAEGVCTPLLQGDETPYPSSRQGLGKLNVTRALQVVKGLASEGVVPAEDFRSLFWGAVTGRGALRALRSR